MLECLGVNWGLHRPYMKYSLTLCQLLETANSPKPKRYYKNKICEKLDHFISTNDTYSNEYRVSYLLIMWNQPLHKPVFLQQLLEF